MIGRRALLHGAVTFWAARPALAQVPDAGRELMARTATTFLASLEPHQRRRATFSLTDPERLNWHYVPRRREGVPFKEMTPASRSATHDLMKASLSLVGYTKAVNIMRLEGVLRQLETFGGLLRDAENYAVTVFGTPGAENTWAWRLEGHHLSLNFTLAPGRPVAVTPAFMGANPALVPQGPLKGLRTLAEEQDLALALARSVDTGLRRRLVIAGNSLGDIVSGPGRGESLKTLVGVALGELNAEQRALALRLIEVYARNMQAEMAEEYLRRLRDDGIERVHFAWAGPIDTRHAHYYRLHGPTLLIEYDNSQNDANHIHSVWHDPQNDFGADLLRAHYRSRDHRA